MTVLLVAIGGAVGALGRYLTDRVVARVAGRGFPWGTLVVNVAGSFLLGLILGRTDGHLAALLGTGFCGALTTYSTFSSETVGLLDERAGGRAVGNVVISIALGLAACVLGAALA